MKFHFKSIQFSFIERKGLPNQIQTLHDVMESFRRRIWNISIRLAMKPHSIVSDLM